LHPTTGKALSGYDNLCHQRLGSNRRSAFFLNQRGQPLSRDWAEGVFRKLRTQLGWNQTPLPRLHDLRHTFAVNCLVDWNRQPGAIATKILALSAYLGHRRLADTYWYLSAIPQLLASSNARFEQHANPIQKDRCP
jgi:integrase